MSSSTFDVRLWSTITVMRARGKTYKVRWVVDGAAKSKTFTTVKLADSFRSLLVTAVRCGLAFDTRSGLPVAAAQPVSGPSWIEHAQALVDVKWRESSPRHRQSTAEGLATITAAMMRDDAVPSDAAAMRKPLRYWTFNASARASRREPPEEFTEPLRWIGEHSRPLSDLEDLGVLRRVLAAIGTNLDGSPASASTSNRKRAALSSAVVFAVERGDLAANPLPRVKVARRPQSDAIDSRVVVSPDQARALLGKIEDLAPALHGYFACLYFAGLRPSEAANLRETNLTLPAAGWGEILLHGSFQPTRGEWTDDGHSGEERALKHRGAKSIRRVPAHPELVAALSNHLSSFGTGVEGRLFVTRTGKVGRPVAQPFVRPVGSASTSRVLHLARAAVFSPAQLTSPLARRPYDLRHACLSTWLAAGVPASQVAAWAGHSVTVLLRVYAHSLDDQEGLAKQRISAALGCNGDTHGTRTAVDDRFGPDVAGYDRTAPDR